MRIKLASVLSILLLFAVSIDLWAQQEIRFRGTVTSISADRFGFTVQVDEILYSDFTIFNPVLNVQFKGHLALCIGDGAQFDIISLGDRVEVYGGMDASTGSVNVICSPSYIRKISSPTPSNPTNPPSGSNASTVANLISNDNKISLDEILEALNYWADSRPLPNGSNLNLDEILNLIDLWSTDANVFSSNIRAQQLSSVSRSISNKNPKPGDTIQVTVSINLAGSPAGLGLEENLPSGWRIIKGNDSSTKYKDGEWLWLNPSGTQRVTYSIQIPNNAQNGSFSISGRVITAGPKSFQSISGDSTINVSQGNQPGPQPTPTPKPTPTPTPTPQPTPNPNPSKPVSDDILRALKKYDTNKNSLIDDPEFFRITNDWIKSKLDNDVFFAGLDYWAQQIALPAVSTSRMRSNSQSPRSLSVKTVQQSRDRIIFSVEGQGIEEIQVQVFDLNGKLVYQGSNQGNRLSWDLRDQKGIRLSNGVYLYTIVGRNPNKKTIIEIRSFKVML